MDARRLWTSEEDDTVRRIYPDGGMAALREALPHRSFAALTCRVSSLRVRVNNPRRGAMRKATLIKDGVEQPIRQMRMGPHGAMYEHGTTAGTKEGLEKVPESAIGLPWVSYPKDPGTLRFLASMMEKIGADSTTVKAMGNEARQFFYSHGKYLRALAERSESKAAA